MRYCKLSTMGFLFHPFRPVLGSILVLHQIRDFLVEQDLTYAIVQTCGKLLIIEQKSITRTGKREKWNDLAKTTREQRLTDEGKTRNGGVDRRQQHTVDASLQKGGVPVTKWIENFKFSKNISESSMINTEKDPKTGQKLGVFDHKKAKVIEITKIVFPIKKTRLKKKSTRNFWLIGGNSQKCWRISKNLLKTGIFRSKKSTRPIFDCNVLFSDFHPTSIP